MDLVSGWTSLWGLLGPSAAGVGIVLSAVGVAVFLMGLIPWLWNKRKGGGGGMSGFPWMTVAIAALLAGPTIIIPLLLQIIEVVINLGIQLFDWLVGVL